MNIYLDEIKFKYEESSWGGKITKTNLQGFIKVVISEKIGELMEETIELYEDKTFDINKLPKEIQDKLAEVFKDVEKYLENF